MMCSVCIAKHEDSMYASENGFTFICNVWRVALTQKGKICTILNCLLLSTVDKVIGDTCLFIKAKDVAS